MNQTDVFHDRDEAGRALAQALEGLRLAESLASSPCAATRALAEEHRARCLRVLGRRS